MKFLKVSRDANHLEIMKHGIEQGDKIIDLAGVGNSVPDLLVARATLCVLLEVKMPKQQIYLHQLKFLAEWPGYSAFVETKQQYDDVMACPQLHCLTDREKQIMIEIVDEWMAKSKAVNSSVKPKIRIMEFEKQLAERNVLI